MKKVQLRCMVLVTGLSLITACKKDDQLGLPNNSMKATVNNNPIPTPGINNFTDWREDFSDANSLNLHWNLIGNPQPQWVASGFGRYGLFDNNGIYPKGSYAISKVRIGNANGYTIESEVYIDVTNPKGTTISPEIGITQFPYNSAEVANIKAGLSLKLIYLGTGITGYPVSDLNKTYVSASALLPDGKVIESDKKYQVETSRNGWHRLKIIVSSTRHVSFYLDDQLVWRPDIPISESLMTGKNIILGYTSPGLAGKAYHDWVSVSYQLPE